MDGKNYRKSYKVFSVIHYKTFPPERYFEKFKKYATTNLEEGQRSFYHKRDGLCIEFATYDFRMLFTAYSLCIVLPASLAIAINTEQLWTGF